MENNSGPCPHPSPQTFQPIKMILFDVGHVRTMFSVYDVKSNTQQRSSLMGGFNGSRFINICDFNGITS
ncbi:unnamed protein product [Clavelina lepadiformis]|uniref:Uncharacterized protein n=1 Tax=Clavelina lepadiformis TaxID=159417 RepID=A0ABP0GND4_CLALP